MGLFRFLARVTIGLLFVGHGTQKLFGWFGGGGLEETGQFFEQVDLRPGKRYALAAGVAEAGGGLLLRERRRDAAGSGGAFGLDDHGDQDRPLGEGRLGRVTVATNTTSCCCWPSSD